MSYPAKPNILVQFLISTVETVQGASKLSRFSLAICAVLSSLVFSAITLKYLSAPWIPITLYWLSSFVAFYLLTKDPVLRVVSFNAAFSFLLLGCLELYSYCTMPQLPRFEGDSYLNGYMTPNNILGYGPAPGRQVRVRKVSGSHLIYDVEYSIGQDGLRATPQPKDHADHANRCVLFFGDSFTFGEGVNDHESMPYIAAELSNHRTYNFGFHGYGPHQMLSAIEHGILDRTVQCEPQSVVYQALIFHVARSAGYASWDKHGPKYILQNGRLEYAGRFSDDRSRFSQMRDKMLDSLAKSYFYQKVVGADRYTISQREIELFLEIVDASRQHLVAMYPNTSFHVILWDVVEDEITLNSVRNGLREKSINVHLMSDILPNLLENPEKYQISQYDAHPSPLAHRLIAEYVAMNIVGREQHVGGL